MENTMADKIWYKTEAEYKKEDKLRKLTRELFDTLKAMEALNQYGTDKWREVFAKYSETFRKVNGYRPHWAR